MQDSNRHQDEDLFRAVAYRFLSRLFASELDQATIDSIRSGDIRQFLDDLACQEQFKEPVRWVIFNLDQREDHADDVMDLRVAFAQLFLVGSRMSAAQPYASYYMSGRQTLSHPCVSEIADYYRQYNLVANENFSEPEDHLALMLGFLSTLASQQETRPQQVDFIEKYLTPWLGDFVADCNANDPDGFYTACASLMRAFVEHDLSSLKKNN
ncbi:molecular chaperone TorD [Polycladidibacter stylochi]|uniref:molecular chaperone TorD n=1 Tax=Polycladidibacter stylochi TaxID=1807766 RepID=UPI00082C1314|nr:molecular chaperone TorD [Pseudovibrio stylochi]